MSNGMFYSSPTAYTNIANINGERKRWMNDGADKLTTGSQTVGPMATPLDITSDARVLLAWHRSHMANERTFLAWTRTSIALMAFGFLIEKFDIFIQSLARADVKRPELTASPEILWLSLGSFALAGLIMLVAGIRFLQVRKHINLGEPSFSIAPDLLVALSFLAIVVMSIVLIVTRIS